jgi:hypothetical protein
MEVNGTIDEYLMNQKIKLLYAHFKLSSYLVGFGIAQEAAVPIKSRATIATTVIHG